MQLSKDFDRKLTAKIQALPGSTRPIMETVSFFGEPFIVLSFGLLGFLLALKRGQIAVEHAFVYAAIAFGLSTGLKLVLRRRRPHDLDVRTLGVKSYSFPSGHSFGTVIFYGLFSYLNVKNLAMPLSLIIAAMLWGLIITIGVSRIYLKAHYPSDVAGGWLLGLASLAVVITLAF